jgi:hypothetical protein
VCHVANADTHGKPINKTKGLFLSGASLRRCAARSNSLQPMQSNNKPTQRTTAYVEAQRVLRETLCIS